MTQIDNAFEAGVHVGRRIPLTLGNCVHTHNKEVKKILTLKTFFGDGDPGGGGWGHDKIMQYVTLILFLGIINHKNQKELLYSRNRL